MRKKLLDRGFLLKYIFFISYVFHVFIYLLYSNTYEYIIYFSSNINFICIITIEYYKQKFNFLFWKKISNCDITLKAGKTLNNLFVEINWDNM